MNNKATYEKPSFKKTKGAHITELRMEKFFVSKGLRKAYEKQYHPGTQDPWIVDGKQVYREIPTTSSDYVTSITDMFKILFSSKDSKDLDKMWSFTGIVELMSKYLDKKSIDDTFKRFLDLQWGPAGQKLERDHKEIDYDIKNNAITYVMKHIPALKKHEDKAKEMAEIFYANYDKKKISESMIFTGNAFKDFINN